MDFQSNQTFYVKHFKVILKLVSYRICMHLEQSLWGWSRHHLQGMWLQRVEAKTETQGHCVGHATRSLSLVSAPV